MTIGTLILFGYSCVQLKMPKEVNEDENEIIKFVNMLPFLNGFTFFEINYVLKHIIYPSLFNTVLNISRVIDVEPAIEFKRRLLEA